jgi:transcriptional regulator with XRE-family HTH domain
MRSEEEQAYLDEFGSWLKAKRESLGWSQQYLGDTIGLSKAAICLYEQALREPTMSVVKNLSKALKVTIAEVMQEKEKKCS